MINTTTLANLQDAIQLFDHYVGKDFLIVSQHSREKLPFVFQIRIRKQNFWHLLGCKLLVKEEDSDETIYEKCKNREDVSKAIGYVRSASESYLKYVVFKKAFDFVRQAKEMRVYETDNTPDYYKFKLSVTKIDYLIGYDFAGKSALSNRLYYPKTAQKKNYSETNNTSKRILLILSKSTDRPIYSHLEYTTSKRALTELLRLIPDCFNVSDEIH